AAIGGAVHRELGAEVHGGITELSLGDWEGFDGFDVDFGPWRPGCSCPQWCWCSSSSRCRSSACRWRSCG
ncbi:MAG: hypothetical protein V3T72_09660, partial [Thermoanaerobaculia bacterium]